MCPNVLDSGNLRKGGREDGRVNMILARFGSHKLSVFSSAWTFFAWGPRNTRFLHIIYIYMLPSFVGVWGFGFWGAS